MSEAEADPRLRLPDDPRSEVHPYTRATYSPCDRMTVRVTKGNSAGLFTWDGKWLSGEIRHADMHLCLWVAGGVQGPRSPRNNPGD